MTLEEDLGYDLAAHLATLKEKCRLLISDHQDAEIIDEAIEKMRWFSNASAQGMIREALNNSSRHGQTPIEYLRMSVCALEQDVWELYASVGNGMERELDFFKEY